MKKPTVCVDFDGMIHQFKTPWTKPWVIHDGPVPGAMEWLWLLLQDFNVVILSARASTQRSRKAIQAWMKVHSGVLWADTRKYRGIRHVKISDRKVPAVAYIDDRAFRFDGVHFPTVGELHAFVPWHGNVKQARRK